MFHFLSISSTMQCNALYIPMCTTWIKAILFLILVHNPPQTSKSEGVKIIFVQKVSWRLHQVFRSAKTFFQNFSKLVIPIDGKSKMKQKSYKNHMLKINRNRVIQIWKMSKIRTDNLLTRQINWNIFWSTGQKLLKICMNAYGTILFKITVWLSLKNFHNGGYE